MNQDTLPNSVSLKYKNHITSIVRFSAVGVVSGILIAILVGIADGLENGGLKISLVVLAIVFSLVIVYFFVRVVISFCKFLYRCWQTIQDDGYAMTIPSKAVGFLFIPVFSAYWIFVSFFGLSNQLDQYIERHNLDDRYKTKKWQTLSFCIFWFIPFLGWFISIILYFMVISDFNRSCFYIEEIQKQSSTSVKGIIN